MKIQIVIRTILTLILIYFSYKETGVFTAICLGMIFISLEILVSYMKTVNKVLTKLAEKVA